MKQIALTFEVPQDVTPEQLLDQVRNAYNLFQQPHGLGADPNPEEECHLTLKTENIGIANGLPKANGITHNQLAVIPMYHDRDTKNQRLFKAKDSQQGKTTCQSIYVHKELVGAHVQQIMVGIQAL
jgi:hypothetical protein